MQVIHGKREHYADQQSEEMLLFTPEGTIFGTIAGHLQPLGGGGGSALPEGFMTDYSNTKTQINAAQTTASSAQTKANSAYSRADGAYRQANENYGLITELESTIEAQLGQIQELRGVLVSAGLIQPPVEWPMGVSVITANNPDSYYDMFIPRGFGTILRPKPGDTFIHGFATWLTSDVTIEAKVEIYGNYTGNENDLYGTDSVTTPLSNWTLVSEQALTIRPGTNVLYEVQLSPTLYLEGSVAIMITVPFSDEGTAICYRYYEDVLDTEGSRNFTEVRVAYIGSDKASLEVDSYTFSSPRMLIYYEY